MQMDSDRVNRVAAALIKDWATVFSVRPLQAPFTLCDCVLILTLTRSTLRRRR